MFLQDDRMSGESTAVNSQEAASSQSLNGSSGGTAAKRLRRNCKPSTLSQMSSHTLTQTTTWETKECWHRPYMMVWQGCLEMLMVMWFPALLIQFILICVYNGIYIYMYALIKFQLLISAYAFSLSSFRWAGLINATSSQSQSTWDEGTSPTDWRNSRGSGAASPEFTNFTYRS